MSDEKLRENEHATISNFSNFISSLVNFQNNKLLRITCRVQQFRRISRLICTASWDLKGRRGFVQCGHFSDKEGGGSSDADVRTFWPKKLRKFQNSWCVSTDWGGRGGWVSADILQTRGGQFFAILCAHLLWTAP